MRPSQVLRQSQQVLIVAGATGTGKTNLSVEMAKQLNGEIINVDSVQMYKECNIGSNKIKPSEMQGIPHHLLDHVSLERSAHDLSYHYTVQQFYTEAHQHVQDILSRNKVPILVGGSAFYINTFINGISLDIPQPMTNSEAGLERDIPDYEWDERMKTLQQLDPVYASKIHRNDLYRLGRAYEIVTKTGKTMDQFLKTPEEGGGYVSYVKEHGLDVRGVILYLNRYNLYAMLEQRCEMLVENGLIEEVLVLMKRGILLEHTVPYRSIGYRQAHDFILEVQKNRNEPNARVLLVQSFTKFLTEFKQATRRYSKQQNTWFRKDESVFEWLEYVKHSNTESIAEHVKNHVLNVPKDEYLALRKSPEQEKLRNDSSIAQTEITKYASGKNTKQLVKMAPLNRLFLYSDKNLLRNRFDKLDKLLLRSKVLD